MYEGERYRLVAIATSGAPESLDTDNRNGPEAIAFLSRQKQAGVAVSVIRSRWVEECLPVEFIPAR